MLRLASGAGKPLLLDERGPAAVVETHGLSVVVTDPAYGARGDGSTDDTAAIAAAIAAAGRYGTVLFPPGRYLVSTSGGRALTVGDDVRLAGAGSRSSVLVLSPGSTGDRLLDVGSSTGVSVQDLGFEGRAGDPSPLSAIHTGTRQNARALRVERCAFSSFMPGGTNPLHAAVYVWPTDGVRVRDCEFTDCGRAVVLDQPDGEAVVEGNRVVATARDVMCTGIAVRRGTGSSDSKVLVTGNVVVGATLDPGGVGAEGHAITVFRSRDVRVIGNHCMDSGRGILVSHESFGAVVSDNVCTGNNDAGIRCEPQISAKDTTVGTGVPRGVTVTGNVCHHNVAFGAVRGANSGIGITVSYAAASVVSANICHHNSGDGIHCDSDRVTISANQCFNNFTGYTSDPVNGRRAGIRVYVGEGCVITGNQCFDSQQTPTQMYGLSLSSSRTGHVVAANNFEGNGTAPVFGVELIRPI